jgi:hypothetical protein
MERVDAERNLGEGEFALSVGCGFECKCGVAGLESDGGVGNGPVLGIVDDAVESGKDGGVGGVGGEGEKDSEQRKKANRNANGRMFAQTSQIHEKRLSCSFG